MRNTVQLGDCLEIMKEIPEGSVDMILCDLPYGTTACKWDTIIPFDKLWQQYERIIKVNGAILLFGTATKRMDKEFEISMYVTVPSHETESSITDKFIEWIESNGYTCVGIIRDSEYNEDEEDGWEYSEN